MLVDMKQRILCLLFIFLGGLLFAEVRFGGLDLSSQDTLLFSAEATAPGSGLYKTLFSADLKTGKIRQLSFFPEHAFLLPNTDQFQIQNRFGVFRTDESLKGLEPVEEFPSFVGGEEIATGKIHTAGSSPDGKWLLYLVPTSFGYGNLVLLELETNRKITISQRVELSLSRNPASWSPDSKYFVYSRQGKLYYFTLDHVSRNRMVAEEFRVLGKGRISSIQWSSMNDLYYITDSLVYKILSAEFFTRSLYSELLEIGEIVGKLPFLFDPNFDSFQISPDGRKILFNKGGRNILLYVLKSSDFLSTGDTFSLPYLYLPRNTVVKKVLWSLDDMITLLTGSIEKGKNTTGVYRFNLRQRNTPPVFLKTDDVGVTDIVLSPDGQTAALLTADSLVLKDYETWVDKNEHSHQQPLAASWIDNKQIIVSGSDVTEILNTVEGTKSLVALSRIDFFGFTDEGTVAVSVGGRNFYLTSTGWTEDGVLSFREVQVSSPRFRVYLEPAAGGSYANMVMVRRVEGFGTFPLFSYPEKEHEPFPAMDEPVDFVNFTHGSRIRRREVALVFNAVDSVEGLTEILNVLSEYSLRCTFFINGEFLRRNPEAVQEIADSGHEVGSLFYVNFDMTDSRFKVDTEFIKRGLARNEDDYFNLTGREISLLWHAPYYFTSTDIIRASREMNYLYIGRDVDPLDWTWTISNGIGGETNRYAADLVERIISMKKPGSIIPLRVGEAADIRSDYLFQYMDVMINGLISLGYEIVPVSTLIEHAK
ncbi:MAG: polysaccharide deacetylase family protein [Spirochaetales bacterium]|nr:polysaccharide deacetylase family protein [Spirochaetales bacterium]